MTNEEFIGVLRLVVREEVTSLREEVNARFDTMDQCITSMEKLHHKTQQDVEHLKDAVVLMALDISYVRNDISNVKQDVLHLKTHGRQIEAEIGQVKDILNLATIKINELQASQRTLEIKVDEHCGTMARETKEFSKYFYTTGERIVKMQRDLYTSLRKHEETPINQAHPRAM